MPKSIDGAELVDREEIKELRALYCQSIDDRDWDLFRRLFTDDCVLTYDSREDSFEGREELAAFIESVNQSQDASIHSILNPRLSVAGSTATGRWQVNSRELFSDGDIGMTNGRYQDEYRKVDGNWNIARLHLEIVFHVKFNANGIQRLVHPENNQTVYDDEDDRLT